MAKTKTPRKVHKPKKELGIVYEPKVFDYSQTDVDGMTLNAYYRVLAMEQGIGVNADRVTLKIRLLVGKYLLMFFENTQGDQLIEDALGILKNAYDYKSKKMRKFTQDEKGILRNAISFVHTLCNHCSLWEQALAYKDAEDQCIPGADKWEYILVGVTT